MPTIKSIYAGNLRTEATHLKSGEKIITDAPLDNNGKGEAFSPTDLLSASLGSCMVTIMGIAAEKNGFEFGGAAMEITKIMASAPRRVEEVVIEMLVKGSYTDTQRSLLENAAINCPVAKSLHPQLKQSVTFQYEQ